MHDEGRYEGRAGARDALRRYVLVTKPRIIELLLITTVPAMVVAEGGWPSTWLVVATVLGGTFSAASANALNNYCDRDIDRLMARTASRPTAADEVPPRGVLVLGLGLGVVGFVWLAAARQPPGRRAGDLRHPLLRVRLHARSEATQLAGRGDRRHRRAACRC